MKAIVVCLRNHLEYLKYDNDMRLNVKGKFGFLRVGLALRSNCWFAHCFYIFMNSWFFFF